MKNILQHAVLTVGLFVFAALGVHLVLPAQQAYAQEDNAPAAEQQEEQPAQEEQQPEDEQPAEEAPAEEAPAEDEQQAAPAGSYQYVAQEGDTYAQMARKAVQTYGIVNNVNLSQAQIIMAETNMTLEAGSPMVQTGQEVEITNAAVEKWVQQAQEIDDATEAAWAEYAKYADFNTNNVGE